MGLFDKLFSSNSNNFTYAPKNEQEAWVAVAYAAMAVDGDASDIEIDNLSRMVTFKTMFEGHDIVYYFKNAIQAHKQIGSKNIIDSAAPSIKGNKETLFSIIMDLLLADGVISDKEQEIAEYLNKALNIDSLAAQKIVEVMLIKNRGNKIL